MFEPTIKYKRVNESSAPEKSLVESLGTLDIQNDQKEPIVEESNENKQTIEVEINTQKKSEDDPVATVNDDPIAAVKAKPDYTFEEEEEDDWNVKVDPMDKERIIVTLSTGKQFSADRYCPHAGADLSFHGKVSEHDYPPEIGPILMCPIHYWEFALEKEGKGGGGWATINACPVEVAEACAASPEKKKLEW